INGLTLGGVGTGTELHHIEVIANQDDGVEFFGGTAQIHHVVTAFCGDDSYDYDEGFRGKGQYWFTVQEPGTGNRGGEHDGGTSPEDGQPYADPVIYNATYIGGDISDNNHALKIRDNGGGKYYNSIFFNWGEGIEIENSSSAPENSYDRFQAGDLELGNNVFWNVKVSGNSATASDIF
ncbi:MAG: hypothetical protein ABEH43_03090, partial [Flavobacteriales bacterium]